MWAVRLLSAFCSAPAAPQICRMRHLLKMRRIDATAHAAEVIEFLVVSNRAIVDLETEAMRVTHLVLGRPQTNLPIARTAEGSSPKPTTGIGLINDLLPKPL